MVPQLGLNSGSRITRVRLNPLRHHKTIFQYNKYIKKNILNTIDFSKVQTTQYPLEGFWVFLVFHGVCLRIKMFGSNLNCLVEEGGLNIDLIKYTGCIIFFFFNLEPMFMMVCELNFLFKSIFIDNILEITLLGKYFKDYVWMETVSDVSLSILFCDSLKSCICDLGAGMSLVWCGEDDSSKTGKIPV